MIYLVSAMVLSTVAMGLAGRSAFFGRIGWSAIAVALISTTAGARDLDVTVDMMLYGNGMFERVADTNSFSAAMAVAASEIQDPEFGYVWLNYVVSQYTHDPHVFYFILAAFCASVIAGSIVLLRDYGPTWLMWLTYLCTAYMDSLNLLRQAPSLALALLGIALVMRKRYVWGAVAGLLGLLFHLTAVIFIPMWLAATIIRRSPRPQRIIFLVTTVTLAVSAGASLLLDLFSGALSDTKYGFYLEETTHGGIALGFETLYRLVPMVIAIALIVRELRTQRRQQDQHLLDESLAPAPPLAGSQLTLVKSAANRVALSPALTVLIAMTALLTIELVILPIRELAFGLYRVPMYFGFTRILSYGVIIGAVVSKKHFARITAVVFVGGYFALLVLARTGVEYQSEIFDIWFSS